MTAPTQAPGITRARDDAAEALRRAEAARVAEADRPSMMASKIDEVQFRRLQEAEQARKSRGRLAAQSGGANKGDARRPQCTRPVGRHPAEHDERGNANHEPEPGWRPM
jgi:hypothetical protein